MYFTNPRNKDSSSSSSSIIHRILPFLLHLVGFISVVLSTSTHLLSSKIFYTYLDDVQDDCCRKVCCYQLFQNCSSSSSQDQFATIDEAFEVLRCTAFLDKFATILATYAFTCGAMSIIQFGFAVYLLTGTLQHFSDRAKKWVIVNTGGIIVYMICLTALWTFPVPSSLEENLLSLVKYLPGFYTMLFFNISFGCVLLIIVTLMLRHVKNVAQDKLNYAKFMIVQHL